MAVDLEKLWNYEEGFPGSLRSIGRSPRFVAVLGFIVFGIAYFLAFRIAISFGPGSYSPLWLPAPVLLCALLKTPSERWWLIIVAMFPIRIFADPYFPLWLTVANIAIDIAKGLLGAIALRRFMSNPLGFDTVRDLTIFTLFAVLLIPFFCAFPGALVRAGLGDDFWQEWMRWFMGDALAQLIVTPAILYWVLDPGRTVKSFAVKYQPEAALIAVGLLASGYWCMTGGISLNFGETRFYAPIPFIFWAALRFGIAGASGAVAIMAAFIVNCALNTNGPFTGQPPDEIASGLQNFLLLRSAPLYFIAALMEQGNAAERAMRESEKLFHSMADTVPVLIWMSGPDKLGVFFNQGWLNFTGRTLRQELGDGWIESVHPEDRQHCLDVCHTMFDTRQPFEVEYRLRRSDGLYRWVLDKGTPRFAEGSKFLGYIGSAIDITDRKETEDENRAFVHVQRLAIMGEMTAAVAHELRQPSTAIMSNAEAALALLDSGEAPSSEMREIVTDIKRANLRANDVLGRIQDFVRKRETPMEVIHVNTLVSDVLVLIGSNVRERRMKIRTDLAENLPAVLGNRMQLQQVLINLLVNGMDAMSNAPDGKRRLVIRISKPNGDARVEVAVSDSGPGIAPEDLPRIFESFFTTRVEGMGLGLSIARTIVESHRGRIWADNNPGGGATFHFTLQTVMD